MLGGTVQVSLHGCCVHTKGKLNKRFNSIACQVLICCNILMFSFQKILGALYLHLPWKLKPPWHHLWADQSSAGGFGAQEDLRPEPTSARVHSSCPPAPARTSFIFTCSSCPPSSTCSACTVCQQQTGSSAAAAAVPTKGKLLGLGSWWCHGICMYIYMEKGSSEDLWWPNAFANIIR